ncbi:unnamed protein product [Arabis nemorensis]|uniref:Uncharacterized protein n=1 Tax=Arabis nemorensis TaxID=586526 RepID=A0A565AY09_9BRAS|nr:unnamed protein product [Arabis nemorensis]
MSHPRLEQMADLLKPQAEMSHPRSEQTADRLKYPPSTQPPTARQFQSPIQIHQPPPLVQVVESFLLEDPIPEQEEYNGQFPDHYLDFEEEDEVEAPNPEALDFEQLLDDQMHRPGREQLVRLSEHPIPNVKTTWFTRDDGELSRVISGIFRRMFDGLYYSWKVTPIHVHEHYFRTFARRYNWDIGITPIITPTLWALMWQHWNTPESIARSSTASQCRNSDRGGLGIAKHEAEYGRSVSFGEVFLDTYTKEDETFVDYKAQQVAEAYEK